MHRVLEKMVQNRRIASAYLFAGPPESGKSEDAFAFAGHLNCSGFDRVAIKPEGASIKIEQIRELQRAIRYGPSNSDYLVAVVETADSMTSEAAAAFLKTLEEPPPKVVFILLAEREDRLPETIASRCQKIIFGEKQKVWQADPELNSFYEELKNAPRKNIFELLNFSARLEKERERIEELLYALAYYARYGLENIRSVRILLEAVKNLKKKASLRLTLDVACLKLGEACISG